jgi:excisionase family DNA binding protein
MKSSYRVDELAKRWDVSTLTIRRMIHDGELKGFRVGRGSLRISHDEIERVESTPFIPRDDDQVELELT